MSRNIKAALLSGLVFPGIGQIYKGCRLKGVILICAVNILFLLAIAVALKEIYQLSVSGSLSGTQASLVTVDRILRGNPAFSRLLAVFAGLWLYGILDALFYRPKSPTE